MSLSAASAPSAGGDEWRAWPLRPFRAWTGSPLWLGAAAVGLYAAVATCWYLLTQAFRSDTWLGLWLAADSLYALSLAYVPVALLYVRRGTERDLERLAPLLGLEAGALRRQVFAPSSRAMAAGLALGLGLFAADLGMVLRAQDTAPPPSMIAWGCTRELLTDLSACWVLAWLMTIAFRVSRLAPEPGRVRLLATGELAVFAHHGTRLALFWLLFWALWVPSLFFMEASFAVPTLVILLVGAAFSGVSLWLPTHAVQRSVRAAKEEELARVRGSIEQARAAALGPGPGDADRAAVRLPGLIAYERRIAEVSESPVDARAVGQVGLYLLIPLSSWVCGALVERVVDAVLG